MVRARALDELRPAKVTRRYTEMAAGSVLIELGRTWVLCTASVDADIPRWMRDSGRGWVTAEYGMLPGSSGERIRRDSYQGGRAHEISRLIGRSLRAVVRLEAIPEMMVRVDCDVLQADGGTRTAAITGAWMALHDTFTAAVERGSLTEVPLIDQVAAVSVGIVEGRVMLDLEYEDDVAAEVDMNVVMTGRGLLVEVQGTAEGQPFLRNELDEMLDLAQGGIQTLCEIQRQAIAT